MADRADADFGVTLSFAGVGGPLSSVWTFRLGLMGRIGSVVDLSG